MWGQHQQQQPSGQWAGGNPPPGEGQAPPPPPTGGMPQQQPSGQWGQQQQPGGGGQYPPGGYGQPPGCCGPDPNQPQQQSCCGPPMQMGGDGNAGCCGSNIEAPFIYPPHMSSCGAVTQQCDLTMCCAFFLMLLSIAGFGSVVGTAKVDEIWGVYSLQGGDRTSAMLQHSMIAKNHLHKGNNGPIDMNATIGARAMNAISDTQYIFSVEDCRDETFNLIGSFGKFCKRDALTATAMLMNISRWVIFRNTIWFFIMVSCIFVPIFAYILYKQRNPNPFGLPPGQQQQQSPPQMYGQPSPVNFYGTPGYHLMRAIWFVSGLIILFWIICEMYQWDVFTTIYLEQCSSDLYIFWWDFRKKMFGSVITAGFFLLWPIVNMCLELVFFILGVVPWQFCIRGQSPAFDKYDYPPEVELEEHVCCRRIDRFYNESHQCKRFGMSSKMWFWLTGSREPFFTCCDQPPGMQPQKLPVPPIDYAALSMGGMGVQQWNQQQQPPQQMQPMGGAPPPPGHTHQQSQDNVVVSNSPARQMPPPPSSGASQSLGPGMGGVSQSWAMESGNMRSSAAFSTGTSDGEENKKKKKKKSKHKSFHDSEDEAGKLKKKKSKSKH